MSTVRMNGYRFNLNTALDVKREALENHDLATDVATVVEAAKAHDAGDKYLNAGELRRGLDDLVASLGRQKGDSKKRVD